MCCNANEWPVHIESAISQMRRLSLSVAADSSDSPGTKSSPKDTHSALVMTTATGAKPRRSMPVPAMGAATQLPPRTPVKNVTMRSTTSSGPELGNTHFRGASAANDEKMPGASISRSER